MMPIITNPNGFYALLAIPAVLAIHFLQHRTRHVRTSTLFLVEVLAPESRSGRTWERLRNSLPLWLQLLCVLLLTWVMLKPRWIQDNAWQTVVFVMDDSLKMQAFKAEAIEAVRDDIAQVRSVGIPTHWVVMTTSRRAAPLYRGTDENQLYNALSSWNPREGSHDPEQALYTARQVVNKNGATRFITMSKSRVPAWQAAKGVGQELRNTGFAGLVPLEQEDQASWRVAVRNYSTSEETRTLEIHMGGQVSRQELTLNPGSLSEFKVMMPPGIDAMELRLSPDAFPSDDVLPIVRAVPKAFPICLDLDAEEASFFNKLVSTIPGANLAGRDKAAALIAKTSSLETMPEIPAILMPPATVKQEGLPTISAEGRHPLLRDTSWGGLLIAGTGNLDHLNSGKVLLWAGSEPLAWLQAGSLVLNWEWSRSNADRLPAAILMLRRYLLEIQNRLPGYWSANLATGMPLAIPEASAITCYPLHGSQYTVPYRGLLPDESGFIEIMGGKDGKTLLFKGAVHQQDASQGDFSECSTFTMGDLDQKNIMEQISSPDPLVPLWLSLVGLALLISWLPPSRERRAAP